MLYPSLKEFIRKSRQGNLIPVHKEILADMETPVSAFRKIDQGGFSFLLESVEGGEKWGRYSFLGSRPAAVIESKDNEVRVMSDGVSLKSGRGEDPVDFIRAYMSRFKPVNDPDLPRFLGGAVGYIGYDMVRFFERIPDVPKEDSGFPEMLLMVMADLLIFDNMGKKILIVSNVFLDDGEDPETAYHQAEERINRMIERLNVPCKIVNLSLPKAVDLEIPASSFTKSRFCEAVKRAKEYIVAGDVIQVVLSQRFRTRVINDPFDIYRVLRTVNPSPYMYYLHMGEIRIVGSSPEVLVRVEGDRVEVRPIAGTRPRGRDEEEDQALMAELLSDPKERAEHIMLVDLGRNDVGRVSKAGSVKVPELMVIEKYSHVMHIVSDVTGELEAGKDAYDVLRACFPAGTVSGAPKIRAMEIIEELEPVRRGPYAGAVGYIGFSGNMDTCITIRTMIIRGEDLFLQAGAGIVADSDPEREYEETINKAKGMLKAMEIARQGIV
ncbi:MAG: anthranilate synthase component I [Nitrospirae bacterium CG_4_9_14_3_um_filter_53_35]|nr:MAG: anthranilate synthase component I [Nitrospirae bacterium CG2_30_53_67]PIS37214.1 MAG: anthranilate synthase component I [Nitrospirae bacterium CG08_land_8_20_14_0_20_52_24]PIV83010.1 MAG: anthranilate synthase component I [Nitrospirae bacterium CG17_big_fil_post_rev_8_21_14_2_50_50_9]PIW84498.1 MAG: anthranilate synthase component I [Nitrospirae bacterium CG_4_8_14_3_um_filter_50_41]PIX86612.1 MAG: anthranilate synthase component I [Nitrospirae bacterium CG_4_10_14_3_um_filter_53_41]PJ